MLMVFKVFQKGFTTQYKLLLVLSNTRINFLFASLKLLTNFEITVLFLGIHNWEPDIYIGFSHLQCVQKVPVYYNKPSK
jgi:hypothetical protein